MIDHALHVWLNIATAMAFFGLGVYFSCLDSTTWGE